MWKSGHYNYFLSGFSKIQFIQKTTMHRIVEGKVMSELNNTEVLKC